MSRRRFFLQGLVLTAVSLLMRGLNIAYRAYLSGQLGSGGMGLYQLMFSVFFFAVTLSTSGFSLAVTRLVTAALARGRPGLLRSTLRRCFAFCLALSLTVAAALLAGADFAAERFLRHSDAAGGLRVLALGLPFMAMTTVMKGYFLAVEESPFTALADSIEQLLGFGVTVLLFTFFPPRTMAQGCFLAMLASALGEVTSFLVSVPLLLASLRRRAPRPGEKNPAVLPGIVHIALPCTLSSAARSLLSTGENLLVPRQLEASGLTRSLALSQYGLLQGMAVPMLWFPASPPASFASLLVPRIALERERGRQRAVSRITALALRTGLSYGLFFSGEFLLFGENWGKLFYASGDAGLWLRILAPLMPLVVLDAITDSLLKGLDEQFMSMKVNCADSLLRVLLTLLLVSRKGIAGCAAVLFFGTIFNAALSLHRLFRVTGAAGLLSPVRDLLLPAGLSAAAHLLAAAFIQLLPLPEEGLMAFAFRVILAGGLYYGMLCLTGLLPLHIPKPAPKSAR